MSDFEDFTYDIGDTVYFFEPVGVGDESGYVIKATIIGLFLDAFDRDEKNESCVYMLSFHNVKKGEDEHLDELLSDNSLAKESQLSSSQMRAVKKGYKIIEANWNAKHATK